MKKVCFFLIFVIVFNCNLFSQSKWPVAFYFPDYKVYLRLTNNVSLNDTATIKYSENIFFKIVLFDSLGKSYCEVYKRNKLYEKGYYENSLDTLKRYTSPVIVGGRTDKIITISKYFQPLKNGIWYETMNGVLIEKKYKLGVEIKSIK
jgi:hypothetical protein